LETFLTLEGEVVQIVSLSSASYTKSFHTYVTSFSHCSHYRATRRRHGIPDEDLRPFNVAYTDAVMRAREEELRKQAKSRPPVQDLPVQASSVSQVEAVSAHNLRQRPGKHVFCCVSMLTRLSPAYLTHQSPMPRYAAQQLHFPAATLPDLLNPCCPQHPAAAMIAFRMWLTRIKLPR
jgi:hypothetical protein